LTIAMALVDLAANASAMTHEWSPLAWRVIGVDLTGIAIGVVFALFARAATRRAHSGDANSVWAIRPTRRVAIGTERP